MATPKQAAKDLIEHPPDQATWNDVIYELYVEQKIEQAHEEATMTVRLSRDAA